MLCPGLAKLQMSHLPAPVLSSDTIKRLRYSLNRMLPPGAGAFADQIIDREESLEYPEERKHLADAVPKRLNEFIAGRRCARAALAKIGVEACELVPDENRIPRWPTGVTGSISHSIELCCAVVAHSNDIACLGVDLETTTRISSRVIEHVIHPLEKDFVSGDQMHGSLIFSAKEAFFIAQFPIWEVWPNFDDLAFQVDTSFGQLNIIEISDRLPLNLRSASKFMQFRYAFINDYVLTLCWLNKI